MVAVGVVTRLAPCDLAAAAEVQVLGFRYCLIKPPWERLRRLPLVQEGHQGLEGQAPTVVTEVLAPTVLLGVWYLVLVVG